MKNLWSGVLLAIATLGGCTAIDDFGAFKQVDDGEGDLGRVSLKAPDLGMQRDATPSDMQRLDDMVTTRDTLATVDADVREDLVVTVDSARVQEDLVAILDLAVATKDLTTSPDLAVPPDLTARVDLAVSPDLAPCGVCIPGAQRTSACGNCGTETDTCGTNCQWSAGSCGGQGPCSPGSSQQGSCDPCSQQTCDGSCQWSSCSLSPGNDCTMQPNSVCTIPSTSIPANLQGCGCSSGIQGSHWCYNPNGDQSVCKWSVCSAYNPNSCVLGSGC